MKKGWVLLLLASIMLLASACKTSPNEGVREAPEIGAIAPAFTLMNTDGAEITLADHRGQVVLINFWATWCPPCRQEMPGIQAMYEAHQGDLAVLAIDNDEPLPLVVEFQNEFDLTFDILLDPGARVQSQYMIRSYPTSLFVDENGIIRFIHIGLMTESQLGNYLSQLGLGEKTAAR